MLPSSNPEPKGAILARTRPSTHSKLWQRELAEAFSDPAALLAHLGLDPVLLPDAQRAAVQFPLRAPRYYVALMQHGDAADPLLRQVLPLADEQAPVGGFSLDPVGDLAARTGSGILHKYRGRALLITTGACAVHCRYCFRRHYPYAEDLASRNQWQSVLAELSTLPDIDEVILSGGDPLSLSDQRLAPLIAGLDALPQLKRLRIHSRQPVVLPSRLTAELTAMLSSSRLTTSLVLHANHPREVTATLGDALQPLRQAGITLLNQAVLLAGVNDSLPTQVALAEQLFERGVLPYYLHQLDPVAGAAHFQVPDAQARALHIAMRDYLPGYLLPRLVCEKPGAPAKLPL